DYRIVHPPTGYRLQRTGSEGEVFGFQTPGSANIRIPYDIPVPPKATTTVSYGGSLRADEYLPTTNILASGIQYTERGRVAGASTLLGNLDQASGLAEGDSFGIAGSDRAGNPVSAGLEITPGATTLGDVLAGISNVLPGSTASVSDGMIVVEDDTAGYSLTDLTLTYSGAGSFALPGYFEVHTAGGVLTHSTAIEIFDSQGASHTLSATFVRTDTINVWDMVLTSISGDVALVDRRVKGITFLSNGTFGGIGGTPQDDQSFKMQFGFDPTNTREVDLDFGTIGRYDGLSQSGGKNTAAASGQNGYCSGSLLNVSVTREGVLVGVFTNGVRRDVAALKLATFQNAAGLLSTGSNYFVNSSNSGNPVPTQALAGGAGAVCGGSLEGSNVEIAGEFIDLIEAQNGFQANARTIRVANEMLRELTNLIR
ncbi:MAG: flagellar hook-basal body complex protein, partial [Candidatus Brocadiae bacterium]|nr:flagellar hook-basal body complex protein [Candidatus Brocadiia bacterium]